MAAFGWMTGVGGCVEWMSDEGREGRGGEEEEKEEENQKDEEEA